MEKTIKNSAIILLIFMVLISGGCRSVEAGTPATPTLTPGDGVGSFDPPDSPQTRTLTVYAAASLTDAFEEIGANFEKSNPGVRIEFNFSGSQVLRTQLEQGAGADVFASADDKNIDLLISENLISPGESHYFTTNRLVVILPPDNPTKIENLVDLAKPGLKLVLADNSVPAGKYARQVLENLGQDQTFGVDYPINVMANLVSNEVDVRQVVTKVELGEADAGMVYVSDLKVAPGLLTIPIPDKFNVIARYPITILHNSSNPELAQEFINYVESASGQETLNKWGFSPGQ